MILASPSSSRKSPTDLPYPHPSLFPSLLLLIIISLSLGSDHHPPTSSSDHVSAHTNLPPPGPDHFAVRRALWLKPTTASRLGHAPSTSCVRLENLLEEPGALERPDVWDAGLSKVWRGLVGGGRLKYFLPLRAVVKILYAGWRRDGTWPDGATVVDDDNFFGTPEPDAQIERFMDNVTPLTMSDTSPLTDTNLGC